MLGTRAPRLRPQAAGVIGRRVIIAAGALGSTQLLLRSAKHLGRLGPRLGKDFGGNGEHLTVAIGCRASADGLGGPAAGELLDSAHGPVSTSLLRLAEANGRPAITVHDVGFSDFLAWIAPLLAEPERRSGAQPHRTVRIGAASAEAAEPMAHVRVLRRAYAALTADAPMPAGGWPPGTLAMLVNGGPALQGDLSWTGHRMQVAWQPHGEEPNGGSAREVAAALGGRVLDRGESERQLCLHPLGGCAMGRSPAEGVVDPYGQVFGCPGLHVADAAILPGPVGEAPALTIAALADRVATAILDERPLA